MHIQEACAADARERVHDPSHDAASWPSPDRLAVRRQFELALEHMEAIGVEDGHACSRRRTRVDEVFEHVEVGCCTFTARADAPCTRRRRHRGR
jgi:hypothetical protein